MNTAKRINSTAATNVGIPRRVRAVRAALALFAMSALLLTLAVLGSLWERRITMRIDSSPPPVHYTVTDLGNAGGRYVHVCARSINNRGQVAGEIQDGSGAFLWESGRFTKLVGVGRIAPGRSLNNRGDVVGTAAKSSREPHVVIFRGGKMIDTGVVGYGLGIDDMGRVVGCTHSGRAFLYNRGKTIDLGTLGGRTSTAQQINDAGQIVGTSETASGESHAFLYSGGKMRDLGTLGEDRSSGTAINNEGWVAGQSRPVNAISHAFLYRNGKMEDLGKNPWGEVSEPRAMNDAGTMVGIAMRYRDPSSAVLWTGGHVYNLQNLIPPGTGWDLRQATSINDRGQITVEGYHEGDRGIQSCILTPVTGSRARTAGRREML
ncbi:MAG TPA: hypothetical protein VFJ58_26570 [Armatimonadota bacterium]|nr:hypothetical protein [Armatimonadota bacterium]